MILFRGCISSVGLAAPVWSGEGLTVKYKPLDWVGPGDFALPNKTSLCLLVPHDEDRASRGNQIRMILRDIVPKQRLLM